MHHTCPFPGQLCCSVWVYLIFPCLGRLKTAVAPHLHRHVSTCLISLFLLHLTRDSAFLKVTVTV